MLASKRKGKWGMDLTDEQRLSKPHFIRNLHLPLLGK
jgi:hypothetical protein